MPDGVRIEIIEPATDLALATRLLEVQKAAYLVEAGLIRDDRIPPLNETVGDVQQAPVQWIGAFDHSAVLLGALAWTENPDGLDIDRLVVDPAAVRRGIGTALVRTVLGTAGGRQVTVSTGRGNAPAGKLYLAMGFVEIGDIEIIPTLWVTQFVRPAG